MEDFFVVLVIAIGVISSIVSKIGEIKKSKKPSGQPKKPGPVRKPAESKSIFDQIFGETTTQPDFGMGSNEISNAEDILECEECGYLNKQNYKFCLACGNSLEDEKLEKTKVNKEASHNKTKKPSVLHSNAKNIASSQTEETKNKAIHLDLDIDSIKKALIMNEILMPPLSLRKNRRH